MNNHKVRTRFAPSPTGYMHVGGLRTALYAYLIAKKAGGTFILRIEDTDRARFVGDATEIIIKTLKGAGLFYDEGPDIGGPCGPYVQSERKALYRPYAEQLCEKGAAYFCFCKASKDNLSAGENESPAEHDDHDKTITDPCRDLPYDDSKQRVNSGEPHVIRLKVPGGGETTVTDEVFGTITVPNKDLDDMVLLKGDNMPTYNFANVVDDHLMEITHVLRGNEFISSAPKYNLLYQAFGWEIPKYISVPLILRDATHKLSKRDGDPTYDDLINRGYLPEAVLNYVALLGWSPGGEREFFTLAEMIEAFDISGISKAPSVFDIAKLNYFNSEYIRHMPAQDFAKAAQPYIRGAVKNKNTDVYAIAELLQARCGKLSDIPEKIGFFDALPDYDTELFVHQKSKTDKKIALDMLVEAKKALEAARQWNADAIGAALAQLAARLGVKNATVMWPVRIAVSGTAVTPGGAVEICAILGHEETLRRIDSAIVRLS